MTPERWRRTEELYHAACTRPSGERAAFLAEECRDDEALRHDVESLLNEPLSGDEFIDGPALVAPAHVVAALAPATMIGRSMGGYHLQTLLGAGGMGEVYRASDSKLGREVAIKVLPPAFTCDPDRLARFDREARMLAALNHPNICAIYGLEEEGGVRFLILELVGGETLADRLAGIPRLQSQVSGLPIGDALTIARQIADAIEVAHEKGIIHRDLKPANIKITSEGVVKVLDFGLAKAVGGDGSRPEATHVPAAAPGGRRQGVVVGTAAYMSPEQARGLTVDKRTDIWAFACVLYEMLTGRVAFAGDTVSDTIAKILEREPDWSALPPVTPAPIRRLLLRCLAKDPKQRLRDIGDVRIEIDAIDEVLPEAPVVAVATSRPLWRRSHAAPWVVAAAIGFGLAPALMVWAPSPKATLLTALRVSAELGTQATLANVQFGDSATLSPDGTVIAFIAQEGEQERFGLYVRRLSQPDATRLSGTDGAAVPFFSPDGQWIGFYANANGKLKKIPATGGSVVTLADVGDFRGAAWSEDDTIVFSPNKIAGTRLLRVSAAGGPSEPLTALAEGEAIQSWPQILLKGKAVLYTSSGTPGAYNEANLVVQPLPRGIGKIVQRGGYHGRYLPSGHLVYIHDGTLFAVPFDVDRLEVTGQPVAVIEGVISNAITGGAQFAVSAGGTLVHLPGQSSGGGLPLHWMDHEAKTTPLRATLANWFNPRFAPDGRRLAMEIREGPSDIWIYEWTRDTFTRVTSDPAQDAKPVWTPGGRGIVFASGRADKSTLNLYWQRADGTGEAQRLSSSRNAQQPSSWHPSGKFLAFEETTSPTNVDIMLLPLEGDDVSGWRPGKPTPLVNSAADETEPMFSPDGRWLAYISSESGRPEAYVRPFPSHVGRWQVSTGGGLNPTWSPTKRELFYGAFDGQIRVAAYTVDGDVLRVEKPRLWSEGHYKTRGPNRMFDVDPNAGERFALAPDLQTPRATKQDHVTFTFNFFDELRRIAPVAKR